MGNCCKKNEKKTQNELDDENAENIFYDDDGYSYVWDDESQQGFTCLDTQVHFTKDETQDTVFINDDDTDVMIDISTMMKTSSSTSTGNDGTDHAEVELEATEYVKSFAAKSKAPASKSFKVEKTSKIEKLATSHKHTHPPKPATTLEQALTELPSSEMCLECEGIIVDDNVVLSLPPLTFEEQQKRRESAGIKTAQKSMKKTTSKFPKAVRTMRSRATLDKRSRIISRMSRTSITGRKQTVRSKTARRMSKRAQQQSKKSKYRRQKKSV